MHQVSWRIDAPAQFGRCGWPRHRPRSRSPATAQQGPCACTRQPGGRLRRNRRRGRVCWSARERPGRLRVRCGRPPKQTLRNAASTSISEKGPEMRPIWILCVLFMSATTGGAVAAELTSSAWHPSTSKRQAVSRHPRVGKYLFGDRTVEAAVDSNRAGIAESFPFTSHTTGRRGRCGSTSERAIALGHGSSVSTATGRDARDRCSRRGLDPHQSPAGGTR